ncbi:BTAD domain-containing putative transcriptional regulator [Streptosporangium sp. NPDC002524]|uniref:BTAD domain-containing putative transcriptional regulator n=1 Tax=Streptosporangium sp. NPDC002524 TaxID=3154537 RepID=UPI0033262861
MRVSILGPLRVVAAGEIVEIGGTRLRVLLVRLALAAGRVVTVEELSDALWPGDRPGDPANAVQSLVSRLRRILPDASALRSDHGGYLLDVPPDAVDAHRFERLAREGRRALGNGDALAATRLLGDALGLWRGPALGEVATAPFAVAYAAGLEEARLAATEDRVEAELGLGRHSALVAGLQELTARHPLRERLHGLRVRALYAAGRQAEALAAYEEFRRGLAEELGADPGPELREIHLAVLRADPALRAARNEAPPARTGARGNLRAALTTFVGRTAEIGMIGARLGEGRLVTLVGPGGVGKTRIATTVAAEVSGRMPGGAWLVELAPVTDPADVAQAVLGALGFPAPVPADARAGAPDTTARLAELLSSAETLVVLDNCEHLVDAAARLADDLLGRCPGLRILATSREPLGIAGEALCPVPPLGLPEPGATAEEALTGSAVRLFADRVAAVRPGFAVTDGNVDLVTEICRRLDGLPLAIELAAARLRSLTVEQLAARLDDRFRLLTGGSRAALPRHRTLRAVVAWSWDLLDDEERRFAERLAVFPAGVTPEAAERVCAPPEPSAGPGSTAPRPAATPKPGTAPEPGTVLKPGTAPEPDTAPGSGTTSEPGTLPEPGTASKPGTTPGPGAAPGLGTAAGGDIASKSGTTPESGIPPGLGTASKPGTASGPGAERARARQELVLDRLAALLDKSLLQFAEGPRYRMLETIREYALERLTEAGEVTRLRKAHAAYFLELAETAEPHLRGPDQLPWIGRLVAERDNILAALHFAAGSGDADTAMRLAAAMSVFWTIIGSGAESIGWLRLALDVPGESPEVARGVVSALYLLNRATTGGYAKLEDGLEQLEEISRATADNAGHPLLALLEPALALFTDDTEAGLAAIERRLSHPDPWTRAMLRSIRAFIRENDGDMAGMHEDLAVAVAAFREIGDRWGLATALSPLAEANMAFGDFDGAVAALEESIRLLRELNPHDDAGHQRVWLAMARMRQGDTERARAELWEMTKTGSYDWSERNVAFARIGLGDMARHEGDPEEAARQYEAARTALGKMPFVAPQFRALFLTAMAYLAIELGDPATAGQRIRQAFVEALEARDMPVVARVGVASATLRAHLGDAAGAAESLGAAEVLRGAPDHHPDATRLALRLREELGDAGYEARHGHGHGLDREAALDRVRLH